jgi:hypothetical protein
VGVKAAAGDEHQALSDLGELVGELHCDPAAKRMPNKRRAFMAKHYEQVAQRDDRFTASLNTIISGLSPLPW